MIVQAIKSKGTTYFHPITTSKTSLNQSIKKIKVIKRAKRDVSQNETEDGLDPWELHDILKRSAEIYVSIYNKK